MSAYSWNLSPFCFPIFSSSFLGLAWELHVRSKERDGCLGGKLDLVWTFMVCIDDSAWFLKVLCNLSRSPFWWFSEPFLVIFLAEFWGQFLVGFLLGVTYEDLVPLWLVTLPQELPWIVLDLVGFRVAWVLDLEGLNPWFPLIVGISIWFLWGRGCPGGNPAIPEVSPQFVRWIERWGDGKLRLTRGQIFWVGRSNRPGSSRWRFWFCQVFLLELVRLDQRRLQVKSRFIFVQFARSSCLEFVPGYRRLDRLW
jgi:hypothetical protein